MNTDNLSPELIEKAKGKTAAELVELAKREGVELTDEQLETISGGGWTGSTCPNCGSTDTHFPYAGHTMCDACGHTWYSGT